MSREISKAIITQHVANGGCIDEFREAMSDCKYHLVPGTRKQFVAPNAEACIKATEALRRCFAGNPEMFKHQFLRRIEEGLDQDLKPSAEQAWKEQILEFRWWNGMRRS